MCVSTRDSSRRLFNVGLAQFIGYQKANFLSRANWFSVQRAKDVVVPNKICVLGSSMSITVFKKTMSRPSNKQLFAVHF